GRTAAGYRKYSPADVSRLRFVLAAQRDHYLPLRVIREQLAAVDRADGAGGAGLAQPRPALLSVTDPGVVEPLDPRLSRDDLLARSGLAEPLLAELEEHGLVRARHGWYDADALAVARTAAQLAEYGLQARHLRGYRAAADREVGLFAQLVAPLARQNTPAAQDRAAETGR